MDKLLLSHELVVENNKLKEKGFFLVPQTGKSQENTENRTTFSVFLLE